MAIVMHGQVMDGHCDARYMITIPVTEHHFVILSNHDISIF